MIRFLAQGIHLYDRSTDATHWGGGLLTYILLQPTIALQDEA